MAQLTENKMTLTGKVDYWHITQNGKTKRTFQRAATAQGSIVIWGCYGKADYIQQPQTKNNNNDSDFKNLKTLPVVFNANV